jgi:hypothetical protein
MTIIALSRVCRDKVLACPLWLHLDGLPGGGISSIRSLGIVALCVALERPSFNGAKQKTGWLVLQGRSTFAGTREAFKVG